MKTLVYFINYASNREVNEEHKCDLMRENEKFEYVMMM